MKSKKKINYWFILLLIFIFIILLLSVNTYDVLEIDAYMYHMVIFLRNDILTFIMKVITSFANASMIIIILLLCFIFIKDKKYPLLMLYNLIGVTLLNQVFKFIVQRPRPVGYRLISESGYSFPSGHSMVSMAFYGLIIYFVSKSKLNKRNKNLLYVLLTSFIIVIGLSRIYLGIHYASDVIAGFCLSFVYLILFITISNMKGKVR